MKDWKVLLGPMRLPFVILAPCCVLLGLGTAYWETGGHINWLYFALTLIGGAAAHISVNAFNEYFDFKTGLDSQTRRTPFSGGSGTLQTHPELQRGALAIAWNDRQTNAQAAITGMIDGNKISATRIAP